MKKSIISMLVLFVLFQSFSLGSVNANEQSFSDIKGHWAEGLIQSAVKEGYVGGFSDGTFRPNQTLTRAEFLTMVVRATGSTPSQNTEGKWYMSYVRTAYANRWFSTILFNEKYDESITRFEILDTMLRVTNLQVISSLGKSYQASDNDRVLAGIKAGYITGDTKGNVRLKENATRAEALVFIERILAALDGKTLPVDELAVEEFINPSWDLWGNKKRMTNLPENYENYPYILEYLPNEVYTMGKGNWPEETRSKDGYASPALVFKHKPFTVENFEVLQSKIYTWFDTTFNVDYKTVDKKQWEKKLMSTHVNFETSIHYLYGEIYFNHIDWVKKNKVKTTLHNIIIEPSTMRYSNNAGSLLRVYYQYSVDSGDKSIFSNREMTSDALFRGQTREHKALYSKNYKMGDIITAVSEIKIGWNYNFTNAAWDQYQIHPDNDLSANFIILK